ncbi:MAG: CPBP family intramembrane metalloprotease [Bacilli bacterium]|nr:CPBP family intramembrane metalloprotease [Bacilli bacterium]MDD4389031.1 CPBP family intramembrane metalloprotease [Bacilli bacterium]
MKAKVRFLLAVLVIGIIIELIFHFTDLTLVHDEVMHNLLVVVITRLITGGSLLYIVRDLDYDIFRKIKINDLIFIFPFVLIVINNLPIASFILKEAYLVKPVSYTIIFALSCFSVALSEEIAFRGIIFNYLKEIKREKSLFWVIIGQAVIFALVHFFNLFFGAGLIDVILQVGYTFLIGVMLAVVLHKTKNIWLCVALHAIYNFGGLLLPTLGGGIWINTVTVIITVVLAVSGAIYVVFIFKKDKDFHKV